MQTTNRNLYINPSYDLQSTDSTTSIPNPKTKAEIAEFIKGQILKGEILDLRDSDIRLLLSDGTILKGAIDRSIPLIIGEHATFVVEQTTDKLLLRLQPQDSNKGFDATVDKALEEAMLPKNEKNITIVNNLLKYGLSIDKNSILSMLRQSSMFRNISLETLAIMNKYQIPMTETNATQLEIYRNYEFRLLNQSEQLKQLIGKEVLQSKIKPGVVTQLMKLLEIPSTNIEAAKTTMSSQNTTSQTQNPLDTPFSEAVSTSKNSLLDQTFMQNLDSTQGESMKANNLTTEQDFIKDNPFNTITSKNITDPRASNINPMLTESLYPEETQLLNEWLTDKFTLSPNELQEPHRISSFYEEVESILEKLHSFFQDQLEAKASESKSNLLSQVTQMKENIDFMKTMNQLFGYVQLPIKLTEQPTHSELFVYTNKKQLRTEHGEVSVLLHLDMTYLGPIDIHLTLSGRQVKAKISLEEESSLNLVKSHLPELEIALQNKGYSMTAEFEQLQHETKVIRDYLESSPSELLMKRYTFDKRA